MKIGILEMVITDMDGLLEDGGIDAKRKRRTELDLGDLIELVDPRAPDNQKGLDNDPENGTGNIGGNPAGGGDHGIDEFLADPGNAHR